MVAVVVLILLGLGLRLSIPHLGSSVAGGIATDNGQQTLADCPATPNCHRDTLAIEADPSSAIETMATLISEQPGARIVSRNDHYLHATWSTRLMGFVDDVECLLIPASGNDQAVLQIRSASRLGKSDLGANEKRIAALRSIGHGRL
ncbi:DUF1499 domain-containing protein [Granulosicoccus sp. 3-233]|uniref:DUF1499 domain-containing protein n=1 Tax=Granulosicoccus sp. 3-233 TaxID=3417969 RepID=UPI003D33CE47